MRRLAPAAGSNFKRRTIRPFKIKEVLPQQKTVNIKKNGQIIKTIIKTETSEENQGIFQIEIG